MNHDFLGATDDHVVVCDNLVKIFKVAELEVVALQGLDLLVERGELMAIVGSSGSGKSTLLNILGGLDRPSAGKVVVDGQDLLKLSDFALNRYRRSKVGFVWQQTARNLIPYLTAQENVELPMMIAGTSQKERREWAEELLEAVGMGGRKGHRLVQMSGGEQQRVAIAVALANHPVLLLADEPTGEVDTLTASAIFSAFRALNERYGLTIMIVTHDPGIASQVDRVVAIRDGRTSSETVRQADNGIGDGEEDSDEEAFASFQEYVVLDSAGRLQLPREFLEELGFHDRAQLELVEGGILVKPVLGRGPAAGGGNGKDGGLDMALDEHEDRASAVLGRVRRGLAGVLKSRKAGG
ncbi:MAG: ABC transporter ATP-binding protein [Anaerolineae bacterium]|nr:ABC transporter ATP-binding protein [Anaerolineae bacterium]